MTVAISILQNAIKNPPKIVSEYLDAGSVSCVHSGTGTVALTGISPAGGTRRGWWSNGVYLCFKDHAVAYRDNATRCLQTLPQFSSILSNSGLVKGLRVVLVSSLD